MTEPTRNEIKSFVRPPTSYDVAIWRYMDFTKFAALLEDRALFFPRLDLLGDPFEGAFPAAQTPRERIISLLPAEVAANAASVNMYGGIEGAWAASRQWTYVSCWHCAQHESAAMWRLYSQSRDAIAIRSTPERLRKLVPASSSAATEGFAPSSLYIGMVEYIDYDTERIQPDFVTRVFRKRKSFEHERELRAAFIDLPIPFDQSCVSDHRGRAIAIEPSDLITGVYVAPQASQWFAELVRKTVRRHALGAEVLQSALDAKPLY